MIFLSLKVMYKSTPTSKVITREGYAQVTVTKKRIVRRASGMPTKFRN